MPINENAFDFLLDSNKTDTQNLSIDENAFDNWIEEPVQPVEKAKTDIGTGIVEGLTAGINKIPESDIEINPELKALGEKADIFLQGQRNKKLENLSDRIAEKNGTKQTFEPVDVKPFKTKTKIPLGTPAELRPVMKEIIEKQGQDYTQPLAGPDVSFSDRLKANKLAFKSGLEKHKAKVIGGDIPPYTGERKSDGKKYQDAIDREDTIGEQTLSSKGVKPEQFQYSGVYPTNESLKRLLGDTDNDTKNSVRSYLARNEQSKHIEKAKTLGEESEKLYPYSDRMEKLYATFDQAMGVKGDKTLGSKNIREIQKGWDAGYVDKELNKTIATLAMVSPQKAAELLPVVKDLQGDIQESIDTGDKGVFVKGAQRLARTLEPMMEAMTKQTAAMLIPGVGQTVLVPLAVASTFNEFSGMETGSVFQQLVENGVEPEVAASISVPEGLINAAIESFQVAEPISAGVETFGHTLSSAMSKNLAKYVKNKGIKKASQIPKDLIKHAFPEIIEETIQGGITDGTIEGTKANQMLGKNGFNTIKAAGKGALMSGLTSTPDMIAITALGMMTGGLAGKLKGVSLGNNKNHYNKIKSISESNKSKEEKIKELKRYLQDNPKFMESITSDIADNIMDNVIDLDVKAKNPLKSEPQQAKETIQPQQAKETIQPQQAEDLKTPQQDNVEPLPRKLENDLQTETITPESGEQKQIDTNASKSVDGNVDQEGKNQFRSEPSTIQNEIATKEEEPQSPTNVSSAGEIVINEAAFDDILNDIESSTEDVENNVKKESNKKIKTIRDVKKLTYDTIDKDANIRTKKDKNGELVPVSKNKEITAIAEDGFEHNFDVTVNKKNKVITKDKGLTETGQEQSTLNEINRLKDDVKVELETNPKLVNLSNKEKYFIGKQLNKASEIDKALPKLDVFIKKAKTLIKGEINVKQKANIGKGEKGVTSGQKVEPIGEPKPNRNVSKAKSGSGKEAINEAIPVPESAIEDNRTSNEVQPNTKRVEGLGAAGNNGRTSQGNTGKRLVSETNGRNDITNRKQPIQPKSSESIKQSEPEQLKTPESTQKKPIPSGNHADPTPSSDQIKAGNYKKKHLKRDGMDISIEVEKGENREGIDKNGKKWSTTMTYDYGYIKGTVSSDKEHVDVFIKSDDADLSKVFVVNQTNPDKSYDEPKVMLGFNDSKEAETAYLENYEDGWNNYSDIVEMSMYDFKKWAYDPNKAGPAKVEVIDEKIKSENDNYNLTNAKPISLKRTARKNINKQVKDILAKVKDDPTYKVTDAEKNILRQYTGLGGLDEAVTGRRWQHYTSYPVVKAMYNAIDQSGFTYKKALEPAVGTGNFVGMRPNANWVTVDLDKTNHQIMEILYPDANNYNMSFERLLIDDFDLIISNVPFQADRTKTPVSYRPEIKALHDYFFVESLDKVNDNGIVAFISSTGTMDKMDSSVRKEIISKADVLGAYRLSSEAFEDNASTSVITDIVFLQKRPNGVESIHKDDNEAFVDSVPYSDNTEFNINKYYKLHPEKILGEASVGKIQTAMGKEGLTVTGKPDLSKIVIHPHKYENAEKRTFKFKKNGKYPAKTKEMDKWIKDNNAIAYPDYEFYLDENGKMVLESNRKFNLASEVIDGTLWIKDDVVEFSDTDVKYAVFKKAEGVQVNKIDALMDIEDAAIKFQNTQDDNIANKGIQQVNDYLKKYGNPHKDKILRKYSKTTDTETLYLRLASFIDKEGRPADVFYEQTRYKSGFLKVNEKTGFNERALASENRNGIINISESEFISKNDIKKLNENYSILGKDKDGNYIYQNKVLYLSGNIFDKIDALNELIVAETNKSLQDKMKIQLDELYKILPKQDNLESININGNEEWFSDFADMLPFHIAKNGAGKYDIEPLTPTELSELDIKGDEKWLTEFDNIMEYKVRFPAYGRRRINKKTGSEARKVRKALLIYYRYLNTGRLINFRPKSESISTYKENLNKAYETIAKIKNAIKSKIASSENLSAVENKYNRQYNSHVSPNYMKASYLIQDVIDEMETNLSTPGKKGKLRQNQIEWMTQAYLEGVSLNSHDTGGGKTFAAIGLARILKKRGLAKKPLFVVPPKTLNKWIRETRLLFPDAKIVNLGELYAKKRTEALLNIANKNADFTFISHEGLGQIALKYENLKRYINDIYYTQIKGSAEGLSNKKIIKELESFEQYKEVMKNISSKNDQNIIWERLGFDAMITDEAHAFKNVGVNSRLSNKGVGKPFSVKSGGKLDSVRSYDFRYKTINILENNNNKNVFLLTATPTGNKPLEVYTMLAHMGNIWEQYGIHNVIDFANMFYEFKTIVPATGGEPKEVLAKMINLHKLHSILDRYVSYYPMSEMKWIKVPAKSTQLHHLGRSDEVKDVMNELTARGQMIKGQYRKGTGDDTYTSIYVHGRNASVDPRLYPGGDAEALHATVYHKNRSKNLSNDKIQYAINLMIKRKKNNPDIGQLVFIDNYGKHLSKQKTLEGEPVISEDIQMEIRNELIKRGVPSEQIAIVRDKIFDPKTKKFVSKDDEKGRKKFQEIQDAYQSGDIRFMIGTTKSMGEGINLDYKTGSVYNLDFPHKPGEVDQRLGRAVRAGNSLNNVDVHFFLMGGTFDALSYGMIAKKRGWNRAIWEDKADVLDVTAEMSEGDTPSDKEIEIALIVDPIEREKRKVKYNIDNLNKTIHENNEELINIRASNRYYDSKIAIINAKNIELNNTIQKTQKIMGTEEFKENNKKSQVKIDKINTEIAKTDAKEKGKIATLETRKNNLKQRMTTDSRRIQNAENHIKANDKSIRDYKAIQEEDAERGNKLREKSLEIQIEREAIENKYYQDGKFSISEDMEKQLIAQDELDRIGSETEITKEYFLTDEAKDQYIVEHPELEDMRKNKGSISMNHHVSNKYLPKEVIENIKIIESDTFTFRGEKRRLDSNGLIITDMDSVTVVLKPGLSEQEKSSVLTHELIGHFGFSNLLRNDPKIYKTVMDIFEKDVDLKEAIRREYKEDLAQAELSGGIDAYNDVLLGEWLAHAIDVNDKKNFIQKIYDAVKKLLIKMGWAKPSNIEELMPVLVRELKNTKAHNFSPSVKVTNATNKGYDSAIRFMKKVEVKRLMSKDELVKENLVLEEQAKKDKKRIYTIDRAKQKVIQGVRDHKINVKNYLKYAREYSRLALDPGLNDTFRARLSTMLNSPIWKKLDTPKRQEQAKLQLLNLINHLNSIQRRKGSIDKLFKTLKRSKRAEGKSKKAIRDMLKDVRNKLTNGKGRLDAKFINELETTQIKELTNEINKILAYSKGVQDDFIAGRIEDFEKKAAICETNLRNTQPSKVKELPRGAGDSLFRKVYDSIVGIGASTTETITEELDGMDKTEDNAVMSDVFFQAFHEASNGKLKFMQDLEDKFNKQFKINDIKDLSVVFHSSMKDISKIDKPYTVTDKNGDEHTIHLSGGHRISLYLHGLNEHNTKALKDGIAFDYDYDKKNPIELSEESIEELTSPDMLSDTERKIADFMYSFLNGEAKTELERASDRINGYPMELVDSYFPLHRINVYRDFLIKGSSDLSGTVNQVFIEGAGSFKERKKNAGGSVLIEDAFSAFYNSALLTASYSNYAMPLRYAKQMIHHLRPVARETHRTKYLDALQRYVKRIEGSNRIVGLESYLKSIVGNVAANVLGGNIPVFLRQAGSYALIATEIDSKYWSKAATMIPLTQNGGKQLRDITKRYSPFFRARFESNLINAELGQRAASQQIGKTFGKKLPKTEYATLPIQWMDRATVTRIIQAAKLKIEDTTNLKDDEKWNAIVKLAEDITIRTQPMYSIEYRSEMGANPALWARLTFMFTSATNAVYNTIKRTWLRYKRSNRTPKDKLDLLGRLFACWFSTSLLMTAIDEVADFLKGKWDRDVWKRINRLISRTFSPFYFGDKVAGIVIDSINFLKGDDSFKQTNNRDRNLLSVINQNIFQGFGDVYRSYKDKDLQAGDYQRLLKGSAEIGNAVSILALKGSVPVLNTYRLFDERLKPKWQKSKADIEGEKIGYKSKKQFIFSYKGSKYKFTKGGYETASKQVSEYENRKFDSNVYKNLKPDEKLKYIKGINRDSWSDWKKKNRHKLQQFTFIYKKKGDD